jgi:hypothetical protein
MLFRAEGREYMVADRAYSPGVLASTDRGVRLFYFAAAVPAVGFVQGPADLYPLNATTPESYPEGGFVKHGRKDTVACGKDSTTVEG